METAPVLTMNTTGVLSESKRIIRANRNHFLSLSLYFLPFTFSFTNGKLFPVYQTHHLFHTLIVVIFALCGSATMTCSANRAFLGQPLTFSAAFKSLTSSFFPLVWTAVVACALLFLILSSFLSFFGVILWWVQNLGLVVIDYNSVNLMWFSEVVGIVFVVIMICINLSFCFVVVVVESKCGLACLTRSSYLLKGMRSVSLYFGYCGVGMAWMCSSRYYMISSTTGVLFVLGMLTTFFMTTFLVTFSVANTVLYNYCKLLHRELAMDVAQGQDHEYVDLPSDTVFVS